MNQFDEVADALQAAIAAAPKEKRDELAYALVRYGTRFHRSFRDIRRQPAARKLFDAMIEEADCGPALEIAGAL